MAYTNNQSANSKVDNGMHLAGNQRVPSAPHHIQDVEEHLHRSPAGGAPLHDGEFHLGHRWSEVDGKVQPSSGKVNI